MTRSARATALVPLLAPLVIAALLPACGSSDAGSVSLEGEPWVLTGFGAGAGVELSDVLVDARFQAGQVSGSSGCNTYAGTYESSGDALTFGPLATTRMACPPPASDVETAYLAALSMTTSYAIRDAVLSLADGQGAELLRFERGVGPALTGTLWKVTGYNNGEEAVVSALSGTELTAVFGDEGRVWGSAGCNSYNGAYASGGATISVGDVAVTEMACTEPEGVMEQEIAYLAALQSAKTWSIRGGMLELRTAEGAIAVTFASGGPAPEQPSSGGAPDEPVSSEGE